MGRLSVLVVGGVALGCAAEPHPAATQPVVIAPPHLAASPARSERAGLSAELAAGARYGDSAPPRVLYTWTRPGQIDLVRKDRRLLIRSRSPEGVLSLFDTVLQADPSPLARLFKRRELSLRRFAWSNPWATLAGWHGESYGDQLVRVELKRDALVLFYDPTATEPWHVTDFAGLPVPQATALAHPERIAAVYHVYPGRKSGANSAPFREFVLVNESMIARWEYATLSVRRDLDKAGKLLLRVLAYARHHPVRQPPDPVAFWKHAPAKPTIAELYAANLAFPNSVYQLDPDRVAALARQIEATLGVNRGGALTVTPTLRFADQGRHVAAPSVQGGVRSPMCWTMPCPGRPHP